MKTSRLEEIRAILGMNKTEFASAMGVGANYYYNILKGGGASNLRLEHLESLLEKHSVNPAWIITGKGDRFLDIKEASSGWIAGQIIPEVPDDVEIDAELQGYLVRSVIKELRMPLLASDLAYGLLLRFGRYHIHRHPGVKSDDLDIPSLTAAFLTLLETVEVLMEQVFQLDQAGRVSIQLGQQTYNFVHHGRTDK